jgi:hypothetical protein
MMEKAANKEKKVTLRTVNNRVSTSMTKALTESIFVEKTTMDLLKEKKPEEIVKKLLNYVYRVQEHKKYLDKYNNAKNKTKRGEANTPAIMELNSLVDEYRSHNSLKKCSKYDCKDKVHHRMDVFDSIQNNNLEVMNINPDILSYGKASYQEQIGLINQSKSILNDLFMKFDAIIVEYESMDCKKTEEQMEYELSLIQLNFDEDYSNETLHSISDTNIGYKTYVQASNLLLSLKERVSNTER